MRVEFEQSIVRRSSGAVWYTLFADGFNRMSVSATVIDQMGRIIWHSGSMTIDDGEHYDLIPTDRLKTGSYFLRISDITGQNLASGRFVIVR